MHDPLCLLFEHPTARAHRQLPSLRHLPLQPLLAGGTRHVPAGQCQNTQWQLGPALKHA